MLEPALRDFLLAASITERICGGLASALAGIPRGLLMLEEVGQRDLFLRREDDEGEWRGSTTSSQNFFDSVASATGPNASPNSTGADAMVRRTSPPPKSGRPRSCCRRRRTRIRLGRDRRHVSGRAFVHGDSAANCRQAAFRAVLSRPQLQLSFAWADVLLQRPSATQAALCNFESALEAGLGHRITSC